MTSYPDAICISWYMVRRRWHGGDGLAALQAETS
jgi:hypothetical protein